MKQQVATSNGYVYQDAHNNITVDDVIMNIMINTMLQSNQYLYTSSTGKCEVNNFNNAKKNNVFINTLGGPSIHIKNGSLVFCPQGL